MEIKHALRISIGLFQPTVNWKCIKCLPVWILLHIRYTHFN